MSVTDKLLEIARKQVGVKEKPLGSNRGKEVDAYLALTGLDGGYPWCAAFVAWCGVEAFGTKWPLPRTADCDQLLFFARKNGILRNTPQPGDVFLCLATHNDATHTGFVVDVNEGGASVSTIEGNSNSDGSREGFEVASRPRRAVDPVGQRVVRFVHWQDMVKGEDAESWSVFLNTREIGQADMVSGVNFFPARELANKLFGVTLTSEKLGWDSDARTISWGGEALPTIAMLRDGHAWCPIRSLAACFGLVVDADGEKRRVTLRRPA
jgi:hypothetical protein